MFLLSAFMLTHFKYYSSFGLFIIRLIFLYQYFFIFGVTLNHSWREVEEMTIEEKRRKRLYQ
jgi:hypothetical protein